MGRPSFTPEDAVEYLDRRLGPHRIARQFHNWCCPFCHDDKYRFGVNFSTGRCYCFKCEVRGSVEEVLGIHLLGHRNLVPKRRKTSDPLGALAPSAGLPWKPLPEPGKKATALGEEALRYLASRGIDPVTAWALDLGFGTRDNWLHHVIHPLRNDEGRLAGWQGRSVIPDHKPKVRTATEDDFPNALGASTGAVYLVETVREDSPVVICEGPYDAISVSAVCASVAILGSVLHDAQARRILARKPSKVIIGFDPDKPISALRAAGTIYRNSRTIPVEVVRWDPSLGDEVDFGDLDAESVTAVLETMSQPWRLGMVR